MRNWPRRALYESSVFLKSTFSGTPSTLSGNASPLIGSQREKECGPADGETPGERGDNTRGVDRSVGEGSAQDLDDGGEGLVLGELPQPGG